MEYNFDNIVKEALNQEANEYTYLEGIFQNIKKEVIKDKEKSTWIRNNSWISTNNRKIISTTLGCILIAFVLLFTFSGNIRSLAADTIERIFVLAQAGNDTKVVDKPMDEVDFTYCCSNRTFLSENELEQKLGYSVHFPEILYGDYKLEDKSLNVSLGKKIKRAVYQDQDIEMIMGKALEDDSELKKLMEYDAYRSISASYRNQNGSRISIYIEPMQEANRIDEIKKYYSVEDVDINNLNGIWVKYKYPEYEEKIENDVIIIDRSKPPVNIIDTYSLRWETEDVSYHMEAFKNHNISIKKAIKIAESFQIIQ
jgi:hypothetical protein